MVPFLKQVAEQILRENPGTTDRVLVVFNNHRPELFLREHFKELSSKQGGAFFLPQTMVIDDLVAQMGGLEVVPNEFLLFELYRIHTELEGDERKYKTFEEFIPFGDLMLADFSEVDRYMVDARDLFHNLHGLKQIGEWDIEDPHMSDFQRSYLRFYRSLFEYYTHLRQRLAERGQAYSGMAYRHVAEKIKGGQLAVAPQATYFVGFNALSECERVIIGEFVRRGHGHLVTDGDAYYYNDPEQEAGYFLRKHSAEFSSIGHYGPSLFGLGEKKITIVECPENVLQCKYAGQLMGEHPDWLSGGVQSTAVVLADESLLIPALNALPDGDYRVNVTMGFPFADSHMHAMALKLMSLYRRHNERGYYHADVVEVLADHYISRLAGLENPRATVSALLEKGGLVRVAANDVAPLLTGIAADLFPTGALTPEGCIAQVRHTASLMLAGGLLESNPKERQAAGALAEVLDYLDSLQAEYGFMQSIDTLENIYLRIAQRHSIAFLGQPLSGLQILGMLETRNLDFRRIILLSAGEGVLPAARQAATLIPHELKRAFNMPTYEERDCVYAYNFYRLLQRAEEVYLVYSSDAESAGKGEESRLLKQVRGELARRFPQTVKVADLVVDTSGFRRGEAADGTPVEATKSEAVMRRLHEIAAKPGFSPTSLSRYVECPMKYYYMSVLGLREQEELEDDIDASQLGEVVHNVLRDIYLPFTGRNVDADALRSARERLEARVDTEMERLLRGGRSGEGRNSFLRSVALTQAGSLLDREIALLDGGHSIEIVALEQDYSLAFSCPGHPLLMGRVDRIDRIDGRLRVIDYKTGGLEAKEIAYSGDGPMPGKWLQLMCYALLYRRHHPSAESMRAGIYPLRYLRSGVRLATWAKQEELTDALIDDFGQRIETMIGEILDSGHPFGVTPSSAACRFCPAAGFCKNAVKA